MNSTPDIDQTIVDGYFRLLDNLSPDSKLDLISKLTLSIKSNFADKKNTMRKSFGAFKSTQTAEELIKEIRSSRTFTREIESF
jgi:hypothetical protein